MEDRIFLTMTKKTLPVPAILIGSVVVLLAVDGYLIFAKKDRKDSLSPAVSQQHEAQAAPPEKRYGKPTRTPGCGKNSRSTTSDGMVWIPGGRFIMGSPEGVGNTNEHPQHAVIVNGFYMDTTEVTQADFSRVMGTNPSVTRDCARCPVGNVTWNEAMTYCNKLGKRLPTEAEWEYACRAKSTTTNYWGNDNAEKYAWFLENSGDKVHPVGQKKPNRFGLYDMVGNVWEWCSDGFDTTYYWNSSFQNPQGPDSGLYRVFRGGSWITNSASLRSAIRDGAVPEDQSQLFGFRCVCTP
jgi:formylglycine-generating enzyme required for sulfatase activity